MNTDWPDATTQTRGLTLAWFGAALCLVPLNLSLWQFTLTLVGLAAILGGLALALASRTDQRLTEIRALLIDIRDRDRLRR